MRDVFTKALYPHAFMLVAAVVALMLARRSAQAEISLTILPIAGSDDRGLVLGISGDGQSVVGNAGTTLTRRAVVWRDASGGIGAGSWSRVDLPSLPASPSSSGQAISGDGSLIAGNSLNTPTLWRRASNGDWTIERAYSDGRAGVASAVAGTNSPGGSAVVAGFAPPAGGGAFRAFRWAPPIAPADLGVVPGGPTAQAFAMSADAGTIIGSGTNSGGNATAWRWRLGDAQLQALGVPTFVSSQARAISAHGGTIGGFASAGSGATVIEPVLWEGASATSRVLPRFAQQPHARVLALSADGALAAGVGYDGNATSDPATALLWRVSNAQGDREVVALSSVLADAGIAPGTRRFETVNGVSWDGRRIAGTGFDPSTGLIFAYVATIPTPGTSALLLGAGLVLMRRRR